MILKGSQRANGADLAIHLMNGFDNEQVEIAEVYSAVADDLAGAFAEFEAVAQGTKAEQYLYSLSINPSAPLTRDQYHEAIAEIEGRLGLDGQPRAVVFHVKDGREHCHVVWSRIDVDAMKAIPMSHDRRRLMDLACDLAEKYGLDLPPGLQAWKEKRKHEKNRLDPSLAEKAQQDAHGISPEQRREEITACYEQADNAEAFINALEQKGYVLARGDKRGFVVVDRFENVHSLTRYVQGHKAAAIKAKLSPLTPQDLPTVDQAKEIIGRRKQAQGEAEGERQAQADEQERRHHAEQLLAEKHQQRRAELLQKEQELLTRQQDEKLRLHAAQVREAQGVVFGVRSAIADLMRRTPGLRSVLGPIQKLTHLDPRERQAEEREALSRRHARERLDIERQKRALSRLETRERQAFEKAMKRAARKERTMDARAGQDFYEAARDQGLWKRRGFKDGDLQETFNDAAEFAEGADRAGDDDDGDRAPDWKQRTERRSRSHRPRRGKGRGYRRDDD